MAAAGRALRTQSGTFALELSDSQPIAAEQISQLETGAVSAAEAALQMDEENRRQFFLVGYTVAQYRLDRYPLSTLLGHGGKTMEADVVATFLPGEVVESLYAAMHLAGLQVASMTLEPIAAMNAAIPAELRLLNLALVDIGGYKMKDYLLHYTPENVDETIRTDQFGRAGNGKIYLIDPGCAIPSKELHNTDSLNIVKKALKYFGK